MLTRDIRSSHQLNPCAVSKTSNTVWARATTLSKIAFRSSPSGCLPHCASMFCCHEQERVSNFPRRTAKTVTPRLPVCGLSRPLLCVLCLHAQGGTRQSNYDATPLESPLLTRPVNACLSGCCAFSIFLWFGRVSHAGDADLQLVLRVYGEIALICVSRHGRDILLVRRVRAQVLSQSRLKDIRCCSARSTAQRRLGMAFPSPVFQHVPSRFLLSWRSREMLSLPPVLQELSSLGRRCPIRARASQVGWKTCWFHGRGTCHCVFGSVQSQSSAGDVIIVEATRLRIVLTWCMALLVVLLHMACVT